MGLASRQYMHKWGCTCPQCRDAYERYKQERDDAVRIAAEEYRRDKEFADNLRRLIGPSARCKHSRPLADGEKWEDTFCNILGVPCHIVKYGSCASEEIILNVEEERKQEEEQASTKKQSDRNLDQTKVEVSNNKDPWDTIYNKAKDLMGSYESKPGIKCPICESDTVLRTAKKGPDTGKKFYVCKHYPECKGRIQA